MMLEMSNKAGKRSMFSNNNVSDDFSNRNTHNFVKDVLEFEGDDIFYMI